MAISGRTRPELLVERLRTNLLSASDGTTAGKTFAAALFVEQLELLNTQVRAIIKRIRERLAEHPDAAIFLSFPGMGEVTAAIMLAEMGEDRGRFPTADVLLAETGTAPVTRSSGRSRTSDSATRQTSGCATPSTVAFVAVRENDWATMPTSRPEIAVSCTTARCAASGPLDTHPLALLDRPHHLRPGRQLKSTQRHHRLTELKQIGSPARAARERSSHAAKHRASRCRFELEVDSGSLHHPSDPQHLRLTSQVLDEIKRDINRSTPR